MRVFFCLTILLMMLAIPGWAQQVAKRTDTGIGYLEHLPPDYYTNPSRRYPLLIFLHGMGERGDGSPASLENVKRNGPPRRIESGHNMCFTVDGAEECFIVISPQLSASINTWFPDITEEIFEYVYKTYRYDPDRVYLTGLSLGGGGTYRYAGSAFNQPNELAAIAPIAGWGTGVDACIIADGDISVWAFHGDEDTVIPYSWGVDIFNRIQNCTPATEGEMKFTTYEGVAHNSWWMTYLTDNSWHTPNLYEWLLSQRRNGGGMPTANAGADKTVQLPASLVTLQGSGTDPDGTITAYSWRKVSGPAATLTNTGSAELTVSNLQAGIYIFELTVSDNNGNTASDQVQLIVLAEPVNAAPVADAGPDISITLPVSSATIAGSGSDSDGSIVSWSWNQISGPSTASLTGASTASLQASGMLAGSYVFRLTIVDDDGASDFDEMTLTVNPEATNIPPSANAGPDQVLNLPVNSTNLTGSGSDPDGTITTYRWSQVSGPSTATLTNGVSPVASASGLLQGIYVFSLQVTDDDGASASDNVTVTVQAANAPPVANAGNDLDLILPTNSAVITGSGTDSDGSVTSYAWSQVNGPAAATLTNEGTATLTIADLLEGTYVFTLEVTDDDGATDTDDVVVNVLPAVTNLPPVASAGPDQTIFLPVNSVSLTGSGTDPDGNVVAYLWSKVTGPAAYTITSPATAGTQITGLTAGTYVFRLTITDDQSATGSDDVTITVLDESTNAAPAVNAGTDRQITLPENTIALTGSASDPDGTIASTEWAQVSGPSAATISDPTQLTATFANLTEGIYLFELTATDDDGASASDQIRVTVNTANVPPVVKAGEDVNVQLPENTVAINGTASDPDGSLTSISWTQLSGPNTATISGGNTLNVTISSLTEGTYNFRLTVTDNDGATASDDIRIIVSGANALPVVNAGSDRVITLPTNTINLNGNAADPDGTITSLLWSQVSGPGATLSNITSSTLTVSALTEGIYVFRLTATDNAGGEGSDDIVVTVQPATVNQPPVANAGADILLTLPVNTTNINGSGSDPDGTITAYAWRKVSGGNASLSNTGNATLSVSGLVEGIYVFELRVTDNDDASATDQVTVTVTGSSTNQAPAANAGTDKTLVLPQNSVTLNGSGSDPDGTVLTYSWTKTSGGNAVLENAALPTATVSSLEEGIYIFTLTVTDEDGASDSDEVKVTVLPEDTNTAPVVNAGPNQTIKLPTSATNLSGSASDADGSVTSWQWTKSSGPAGGTIVNANSAQASVSGLTEGFYTFTLRATDNEGATGTDRVSITVLSESLNAAPVADAGADVTVQIPDNHVTLYGKGTDPDGAIVSYAWTKVAGPSSFNMDTPNRSSVRVSSLVEGTYILRLTVTDDEGGSGSDEITLTVQSETSNLVPYANAGADKVLYLPTNTVTLNGTAVDTDGSIDEILWVKVSGGPAVIANATSLTPSISDLEQGSYTFRVTVTDNENATSSDDMLVLVQPSTVNQPPDVSAGQNLNLILPENSGTITATASDADGVITSVNWSSLDAAAPGMSGVNTLEMTASNLEEGIYGFQVTVTDDDGLEASDVVYITVSRKELIPPVISMMEDFTTDASLTELEIWAVAADDGTVVNNYWEQVLGPPVSFGDAGQLTTTVSGVRTGTYEFRLTAVDDDGLTSTESVIIHVVDENSIENAFPMRLITPNGDYDNERWVLDPDATRHARCRLIIYDRNGQEVYDVIGYNNEWNAMRNGKELPEGVYYYFLKCEEEGDAGLTGSITVIR